MAFVSTVSGNTDVYTLPFAPDETATMSAARNVTNDRAGDFRPAFSPDGKTLAFSSDRGLPIATFGNTPSITRIRSGDIYTVDLASSQTKRRTDAPGWDGSPAWSLDGKTIVFYSERGTSGDLNHTGLFAMNADGSNQHSIAMAGTVGALSPSFLPDGRIVFARRTKPYSRGSLFDERGAWQIVSVRGDGSDLRIEGGDGQRGPRRFLARRRVARVRVGARGHHRRDPAVPRAASVRRDLRISPRRRHDEPPHPQQVGGRHAVVGERRSGALILRTTGGRRSMA